MYRALSPLDTFVQLSSAQIFNKASFTPLYTNSSNSLLDFDIVRTVLKSWHLFEDFVNENSFSFVPSMVYEL